MPLKTSSLNAYLAKTCAETLPSFEGKKCTCTLLRRMFVSWKRRGDMTKVEKEDMAKNMSHSPAMQEGYIQEDISPS